MKNTKLKKHVTAVEYMSNSKKERQNRENNGTKIIAII